MNTCWWILSTFSAVDNMQCYFVAARVVFHKALVLIRITIAGTDWIMY